MLTLRQIEVIRAIMVTGTVGGAARLLNVSSPGISRVMKHAEMSVGVKLFSRKGGRYSPTREANAIFNQINSVYDKVEDLQFVISRIKRGANIELKIGSVPSIANVMVPRAIADVRKAFPNLLIEIDILKIEDAVDYLLLGKGELVAHEFQDRSSDADLCAAGARPAQMHRAGGASAVAPVTRDGRRNRQISADRRRSERSLWSDHGGCLHHIRAPLRGHDPRPFRLDGVRLVTNGLGIAIIDEFTLAGDKWPNIRALDIVEPTTFQTYMVHRKDTALSSYGAHFVAALRGNMDSVAVPARTPRRSPQARAQGSRKK